MSGTRSRIRDDGTKLHVFGDGPGEDRRTSVLVVAGDDDWLSRAVADAVTRNPRPVLIQARAPGSEDGACIGEAFDPDVWALLRARFAVLALALIRLGGSPFPDVAAIERWSRRGTPVLVGLPDLPGEVAVELPPGWSGIRHPGRAGVVGLPGSPSWLEGYRDSGRLPDHAVRRSFVHALDLATAYAAAAERLLQGQGGLLSVGPCPVWDPERLAAGSAMPEVVELRPGSATLPASRSPHELWAAAGRGGEA